MIVRMGASVTPRISVATGEVCQSDLSYFGEVCPNWDLGPKSHYQGLKAPNCR